MDYERRSLNGTSFRIGQIGGQEETLVLSKDLHSTKSFFVCEGCPTKTVVVEYLALIRFKKAQNEPEPLVQSSSKVSSSGDHKRMRGDRSLDQCCFYRRHSNEEKRSSGQPLQSLPQEIREDHSDEDERPDGTLNLDSPGKSFKKQSSGLSAQRSGLSQQRSGLGQQRSGLGMQKSGLSDKEGGNADSKVAEKPPRPSFWRLLALNKPEWPYLLLGTIGAIAAGLVNPFWALIVSQVRDSCRLLIGVFGICVCVRWCV